MSDRYVAREDPDWWEAGKKHGRVFWSVYDTKADKKIVHVLTEEKGAKRIAERLNDGSIKTDKGMVRWRDTL